METNFNKISFAICLILLAFFSSISLNANQQIITNKPEKGSFMLAKSNKVSYVMVSPNDFPGVQRAADDFVKDLSKVTSLESKLITNNNISEKQIVIIGTIGKSPIIDNLIENKKIDVSDIINKWETFIIQVVDNPFKGIEKALIIVGSDKRGTIYGTYELSSQIGVSPWYFWADVPAKKQSELYVKAEKFTLGEPKVKYRGIFLNDEAPALSGWTRETNGGFNHKLYTKVFELILRLKGNYLWPAMWGNAFNIDDTLNNKLADEYGIVMGTSHHEPMLRAQQEWKAFGKGPWNYKTNKDVLSNFWRNGIKNMGKHESIVTIGMRGDGDEPMSEDANIALLEQIVKDQRQIIEEETGKPASETPQLWALYKEVQEYYDKGMRVPDDVTLLLCDDNWGNIRKLPAPGIKQHAGGFGIYYHFDYVGGPRNYKWLNTNQIERTWEQMHLAYEHGVNRIWLVNVGDLKPVEFPISFFLDYAWDPEKWNADNLDNYTEQWAASIFGKQYAPQIASIIKKYTKFNSRRKPEMLSPETYSLLFYREAEQVVEEYNQILVEAENINSLLPNEYKDAFFQLVLHPVKACANINELYVSVAKNRLHFNQGRTSTNELADKSKELFKTDAEISKYYNKTMAGGKWNHMMDQTHIGYTYWQQPDSNSMPVVKTISVPDSALMGVAVEGNENIWPKTQSLQLPDFNVYENTNRYFEIFKRGTLNIEYQISADKQWVKLSTFKGKIDADQRVWVTIDWKNAPKGKNTAIINITNRNSESCNIALAIINPETPKPEALKGFIENNGYVAMEAAHYTNKIEVAPIVWKEIRNLGRTSSAMAAYPTTIPSLKPSGNAPRLEYNVFLTDTGTIDISVYLSPTLSFNDNKGLSYAISVDDESPQTINIHTDKTNFTWEKWVGDNIHIVNSKHHVSKAGEHIVKFWLVDSGIVLQRIVIDCGGVKPSYLGPTESFYR